MAAIVTSNFRVLNAENFKQDVADTSVYVSVGKSDAWSNSTSDVTDTTPFSPNDTFDDLGEARQNMIGLKKIASADIAHVVPRHTWTTGTQYVPWDSDDAGIFDKKFYAVTSEFKVYKCINAPSSGGSTIQPTQTLTQPVTESDQYTWKYMYTITVADAEKFLTNSFMPVKTVPISTTGITAAAVSSSTTVILKDSNTNILVGMRVAGTGISGAPTVATVVGSRITLSGAQSISADVVLTFDFASNSAAESALNEGDYAQYLNQKASLDDTLAGGIERVEITSSGSGYSGKPTVTITGDGSDAAINAAEITMAGSGSSQSVASMVLSTKGTNYNVANISMTGNATARAVISPKSGHGVDPVRELGAFFVALNTKLDGAVNGDITVDNDFRQVMLIKEPRVHNATPLAGTIATADSLRAIKGLDFASGLDLTNANASSVFPADSVITGGTSGAKAFVAERDITNDVIRYYQNQKTGFGVFANGETVSSSGGGSHALESSNAVLAAEVDKGSGSILFLENRNPISRSATQIEDIKLILEF